MNKIVYNACYGGFELSDEAKSLFKSLKKAVSSDPYWSKHPDEGYVMTEIEFDEIPRHDPMLVAVVEMLGEAASTQVSDLRIEEIEGNIYRISEYDGLEEVIQNYDDDWVVIKEG